MQSNRRTVDVPEEHIEAVLDQIDETSAKTIRELAGNCACSTRQIRKVLEFLMERGEITSTPDWKYRRARKA